MTFQFNDDNEVSIFARSKENKNRGKYLFEICDIILIDNAQKIAEAVETTIYQSYGLDWRKSTPASELIREVWSHVEVRVVGDSEDSTQ